MYIYNRIAKVEDKPDGTIKVYGYASAPVRDAHGEIVSAEAMRNAVEDYMRFPAVREMHDANKAAGRGLEITFDDDDRSMFVAHVVDSEAIKKVKAGVYSGFSIGGRVKKRNSQDPTIIQRIDLMEISLVDRPSCPVATLDLWKRRDDLQKDGDDGDGVSGTFWEDKDRWDDGFDFFGQGGDRGQSEGPMSTEDGGPYRSQTPRNQSDDGSGGGGGAEWNGSGEWGSNTFGGGSDAGSGQFQTDANGGKNMVNGVPNSTVNTAQQRSDVGGSRTGDSNTGGGNSSSSADYFTPSPGTPANLQRLFDMMSEMYAAHKAPPVDGAFERRSFTAEQRKRAARSGAAMKDGSYPIENKSDLANAVRAIGRSKNPDATKTHIKRRAAALGATSMLPESWKSAESEGGLNNRQRNPAAISHIDGDNDNLATKMGKTDDLLKTTLASLERLEVRTRRGVATPEAYRLAKAYKAMSDDELAEVLAQDAITKIANNDGRVSTAESLMKQFKDDNAVLLQKLADTNAGLEQLQARVQKLAEMPMPTKTAGSQYALSKNEDAGGPRPLSPDDLVKAKAAFEALSEEERVLLLTKVSLANPRRMNLDTVPAPSRSLGGTAGREELR